MCMRVIMVLAASLMLACSAYAQVSSRESSYSVFPSPDCTQIQTGGIGPGNLKDHISWCQKGADAPNYTYTLEAARVGTPRVYRAPLIGVFCVPSASAYHCAAPLPTSIKDAIARSEHLNMDLTATAISGFSARTEAPLQLAPTNPSCAYTPPGATAPENRPLDAAIGGVITQNSQLTAERVGQLRRDGWRVEWQWDPGSNPSRILVMMWCVGRAQ